MSKSSPAAPRAVVRSTASVPSSSSPLQPLPLGAMAAGMGLSLLASAALAQSAPAAVQPAASAPAVDAAAQPADTANRQLPTVTIKDKMDKRPEAKQTYQAVTTTIGKGKQALRDIPQSVTVVTEKLMDDRNQDTVKEALKNTAGITFLAAEGGEEDIRLRGFSMATAGDIFADGMRDPAFYERDTFNNERIELIRGSASMLFGRGSTGGAVNQVSKQPFLGQSTELTATVGMHAYRRVTADANVQTGDRQALRINAMKTEANNNGAGSSIDKEGLAGAYRWGIGTPDEVTLNAYHLENNNGINYGLPWIRGVTSNQATSQILPGLDPADYFGLASDRNKGSADFYTLTHVHRVSGDTEIRNSIRRAFFTRDQRASTIRIPGGNANYGVADFSGSSVFNRNANNKIQDLNAVYAQTDLSTKLSAFGIKHQIQTGADYALEKKRVFSASATPSKTALSTTAGNPDDGAWVDESARTTTLSNGFRSQSFGAYVQDLMQVAPHWKVLGGLRYDMMKGRFNAYVNQGNPLVNNAPNPNFTAAGTSYVQNIYEWSNRFGVLYQPNALQSYHFSYGTSFNTSGDTYSYNRRSANTPPESSRNIELGAKLDSEDGDMTTRLALFHSTKYHERNTDGPSAADMFLLSGKRHSAGFEVDVTGRITEALEIYLSYTYMPIATVDEGSGAGSGSRKGDRSGLSPKHSGTVWATYQVSPAFRAGAGVNFRSAQSPADIGNPQNGVWSAPGWATLDLMGEYSFSQNYSLKANLSNAGNKYYADSLYRGHYIPGAGRNLQVTLNARF